MLCYADAYVDYTIKNSYIILTETGSIVFRHDCYFRHSFPKSAQCGGGESSSSQVPWRNSNSDGNTGSEQPKKDPTVPMKPTFDVNAKWGSSNQPIHEEIG
jgi:hypothetical protein